MQPLKSVTSQGSPCVLMLWNSSSKAALGTGSLVECCENAQIKRKYNLFSPFSPWHQQYIFFPKIRHILLTKSGFLVGLSGNIFCWQKWVSCIGFSFYNCVIFPLLRVAWYYWVLIEGVALIGPGHGKSYQQRQSMFDGWDLKRWDSV